MSGPGSSQRDLKLSNIRQALSKYDAKYVLKSSALFIEDSSDDDARDEISTSEQFDSRKLIRVQYSSTHRDDDTRKREGKPEDPERGSLVGTSLSPTVEGSEGLKQGSERPANMEEGDKPDSESSVSLEENSVLKTASSMDSIKTDSSAGFNNIHSVSSLADSVVPQNDVDKYSRQTPDMFNPHNISNTPLSYTAVSSVKAHKSVTDEEINEKNYSIATDKSVAQVKTDAKPEHCEDFHISKISKESSESHPIGSSCKISQKSNTSDVLRNPTQKTTDQKCRSDAILGPERKSVAVQTSQHCTCSTVTKQQAKPSRAAKNQRSIPVLKPTKLPCFVKDEVTCSTFKMQGCNFKNGRHTEMMKTSLEMEVSELVSQHLLLVEEFLQRQHRMYLANCKAVQLLEYAYKQKEFLCSSCEGNQSHFILTSTNNPP